MKSWEHACFIKNTITLFMRPMQGMCKSYYAVLIMNNDPMQTCEPKYFLCRLARTKLRLKLRLAKCFMVYFRLTKIRLKFGSAIIFQQQKRPFDINVNKLKYQAYGSWGCFVLCHVFWVQQFSVAIVKADRKWYIQDCGYQTGTAVKVLMYHEPVWWPPCWIYHFRLSHVGFWPT